MMFLMKLGVTRESIGYRLQMAGEALGLSTRQAYLPLSTRGLPMYTWFQ